MASAILKIFPKLREIGLNLEVSCESKGIHQKEIMKLLRLMRSAGVRVVGYEVLLIQLPSSQRLRSDKLMALRTALRRSGVHFFKEPRARSTKEFPCDGFRIPASFSMNVPRVVAKVASDSLWQSVWP